MENRELERKLITSELPYLHPKVDSEKYNKLNKNMNLIREYFGNNPDSFEYNGEPRVFKVVSAESKEQHFFAFYQELDEGGAEGSVSLGYDIDSGKWVAIKSYKIKDKVDLDTIFEREPIDLIAEKETKIIDKMNPDQNSTAFMLKVMHETKPNVIKNIYTVIPLEEGIDLSSFRNLPTYQHLSLAQLIEIAMNTTRMIGDLHKLGILHKDIKPANLMINIVTGHVKPIDFGASSIIEPGKELEIRGGVKGTKGYVAPEMETLAFMAGECIYNEKTEVFALGVTLDSLFRYATHGQNLKEDANQKVQALIERMTSVGPEHRPTIQECIIELKKIQSDCLNLTSNLKRTGLLDIAEYQNANKNEKIILIKKLRECNLDEIQFLDPNPNVNRVHYAKLRAELTNEGLPIGNKVHSGLPVVDMVDQVRIYHEIGLMNKLKQAEEKKGEEKEPLFQEQESTHFIRAYVYVTNNKPNEKISNACVIGPDVPIEKTSSTVKEFLASQRLTPNQIQYAKNILEKEHNRLIQRYGDEKQIANPFIVNILEHIRMKKNQITSNTTYAEIDKEFRSLEKKMAAGKLKEAKKRVKKARENITNTRPHV